MASSTPTTAGDPARSAQAAHLALPTPTAWRNITKHPLLFPYNRLIALVLLVNLLVLVQSGTYATASDAVLANLTLAVLIRQPRVWNFVFSLARRLPDSWPLWIRGAAAKVYHMGGLHVGAGISAMIWYIFFTVDLTKQAAGHQLPARLTAVLFVSYVQAALLLAIVVLALPAIRRRWHDLFERSHRFAGWFSLLLFWVQTLLSSWEPRDGQAVWMVLLSTPQLWVLLVCSASVASSWTRLRKVRVSVSRPSSHAALLRFDYGWTPFNGSSAFLSRSPLKEWHAFAGIDVQQGAGYRIMVSRAGDWTSRLIDNPPDTLWVKQIAIRGMASVESLFNRVLFVATGSGIGPTLTHLVSRPRDRPMALVWVTRTPRQIYGDDLVDEILSLVPDALIVDTAAQGKPDVVALAYRAARDFRADGVICVANKKVTWDVVHGLESRGIAANGALWDS
ncbi:hypothetical protein [Amycolatopsis pithecellobii]|uniref:Uncharacterized protein n=1 Tax=Amycolatopsis pithecellobii TaxID=664692 RepID=A0A6N7Z3Q3_9PSEU|nr:hypothetical protein [Amycolatopsis pithecellobii]MTD56603.1 hypothetical protein [Amycolatopsis pithecellobii]